jgi:hypothetical protein
MRPANADRTARQVLRCHKPPVHVCNALNEAVLGDDDATPKPRAPNLPWKRCDGDAVRAI